MKGYHSTPTGAVVAVITDAELADWIGVGVSDPLLSVMALTATAAAIEYLQFELINSERVTTYEEWPTSGTLAGPDLAPSNAYLERDIAMPYAMPGKVTVSEVLTGGEANTDYRILSTRTAALRFDTFPALSSDVAAIKMTYVAGYGPNASDVPRPIRTAVLMAADFLYNNRGACSASDALDKSGAATVLFPYKAQAVVL
jgi:hypothetical protein